MDCVVRTFSSTALEQLAGEGQVGATNHARSIRFRYTGIEAGYRYMMGSSVDLLKMANNLID